MRFVGFSTGFMDALWMYSEYSDLALGSGFGYCIYIRCLLKHIICVFIFFLFNYHIFSKQNICVHTAYCIHLFQQDL